MGGPLTVDLISALAPRRTRAKLMLIATNRPMCMVFPEHPLKALKEDLLVHELSQEIALEPLGEAEVAEYLGAGLDPSLPQGLAKLIYDHSEGNQLFIMVALDHMSERGLISGENGAWKLQVPLEEIALGVPQKLRRMIETQIDRLTPDEQRALEAASVAGIAFATEVCAAAANLGLEAFEDLCQGWRADITSSVRLARSNFRRGMSVRATNSSIALPRGALSPAGARAPHKVAPAHCRALGDAVCRASERSGGRACSSLRRRFRLGSRRQVPELQAETAGRRYAPREAAAILQHALELTSKLPGVERAASETGILQTLATMYVVSFDMRAIETYEALIACAARYGLIDAEVKALIDLAYPLSWASTQRCLEVVERALRLSGSQKDPLMRAGTRELPGPARLGRRVERSGYRGVRECTR